MDAGGLAQMSHTPAFVSSGTLQLPTGGLASRRGGQGIKPLSIDALKSPGAVDPAAPTPRTTARSHLLAGLRTAPKSATAATFASSGTVNQPAQSRNRNSMATGQYDGLFNGPKTSLPYGYGQQQQQPQHVQQQQQLKQLLQSVPQQTSPVQQPLVQQPQVQQQQQSYNGMMGYTQQPQLYTADQILAPPEIILEDQAQEQMDPTIYANLVSTNMYLAQQQQRLQQQLMTLQAAQQQFQGLSLNGSFGYQNVYQHQQQAQIQQQLQQQLQQQTMQLKNMQQQLAAVPSVYTVYDPVTGQNSYIVDPQISAQQQLQQQLQAQYGAYQQVQTPAQTHQTLVAPRVQVSPPPAEARANGFRNPSPPRRYESPDQAPTPLPPPSANAFRRGHKKSSSVTNSSAALSIASSDATPKSPGPKTASFPLTPLTGGYGPGQARAGEHPVRQPRGPPSFDELCSLPTSKHEGSKNFVGRMRRSALSNLVRAGITRRQASGNGSSGSISPISETAEEQLPTPLTEDDESVSGRSGSGSLNGDDVECSPPSSRTSTGSWGAIGSDRPSSRQKAHASVDSVGNASGDEGGSSFASVFKSGGKPQTPEAVGQRKTMVLVKRKSGSAGAA